MSDNNFNPCECIWYNEVIMQRLLSILRQTQGYCTDNECFSISRLPGPQESPTQNFFLFFLVLTFIALMYAFRPNSLRSSNSLKFQENNHDTSGDPPAGPQSTN
ncbi:small integral membrane protein 14 [Prorops nasuta]|uniref:small integral membrane protein 14 n=1 Tax=Prorops nasuta TaxID=863751 RepID=UPI0034CD1EA1